MKDQTQLLGYTLLVLTFLFFSTSIYILLLSKILFFRHEAEPRVYDGKIFLRY